MKRWLVAALAATMLFLTVNLHAQVRPQKRSGDTTLKEQHIDTVTVVSSTLPKWPETQPINITSVTLQSLKQTGALNIGEALAKLPGISMLSTGSGINKPVIRGLFGNRIQIRVAGLRFDSQQWQDEHASGINDVGISKVEIVKGPASVIYGPDAVGGVINVLDEEPAPLNTIKVDLNTAFYSSTLGNATDIGISKTLEKAHWHIRAGIETHGDYSDGNNDRVLNSRYDGYYLKAGYGFHKRNWKSENNFQFSANRYGFVFESGTYHLINDTRYSRSFASPHHTVIANVLSSLNTIQLKSSELKLDVGLISNLRQEQEGGNMISLNMLLNTVSVQVAWLKTFDNGIKLQVGQNDQFQNNKNLGSRTIIPDASNGDVGAFALVSKLVGHVALFEVGISYNLRAINTQQTGNINGPGQEIQPFSKVLHSLNGTAGVTISSKRLDWILKVNGASGTRAPNLAELSSDGLHEGTSRFEIGDTKLKNEQNLNGEVSVDYKSKYFSAGVAGFINRFFDYIYLNPTAEYHFGFQIYRFLQKSATMEGGEANVDIRPGIQWLTLHADYSMVIGKTDDGNYLPYMPAFKINSEIKATHDIKKLKSAFAKVGVSYCFKQNSPAQFETPTPNYYLLNAGFGTTIPIKRGEIIISLIGNNLLNKTYVDHLSRYKYFGLYNMGRNITLSLNIPLSFNLKNQ